MLSDHSLPPTPLDRIALEAAFHQIIYDARDHEKDRIIVFAWLAQGNLVAIEFDDKGDEAVLSFRCVARDKAAQ